MSTTFDPYYKWLAIPPAEQPPNHYRLLAVNAFESDPDVISTAADQRMAHVRSFQGGQYVDASQRLLNELAAARLCLLRPEKKAAYDAALRHKLANQAARASPPPLPSPVASPILESPLAASATADSTPAPITAAPITPAPIAAKPITAAPVAAARISAAPIAGRPKQADPAHEGLPASAPLTLVEDTDRRGPLKAVAAKATAAHSAAELRDEIDPLGLADSDRYPTRPALRRSPRPLIPRIVFLGPLAGVGLVLAAVMYANVRDAIQQWDSGDPSGRIRAVKRPTIAPPPHPAKSDDNFEFGSTDSNRPSSSAPQFSSSNDTTNSSSVPSDGLNLQAVENPTPDVSSSGTHGDKKKPAVARLAVPDAELQRKALVELKKVYKDEFAKATSIEGRQALARKFSELAANTSEDPTIRYVMATQALELSVKLCDARSASDLVGGLCLYYDVDSWELKAKTLAQLGAAAKTAEARQLIGGGALALVDKALAEEHYDAAVRLATTATDLAATLRDMAFREKAHETSARAHRMQQEALQAQAAQDRLAIHTNDPKAHLLLGRFYCLERDDWDTGLPHLVECSDPELRAIARRELAGAARSIDQVALADAWWELADQRREAADTRLVKGMQNRAVYWYRRALPKLSGFAQSKAEKRIAEVTAAAAAKP